MPTPHQFQPIIDALNADKRSSSELARLSGVHRVTINKFKCGMEKPGLDSASKLAPVLGFQLKLNRVRKIAK